MNEKLNDTAELKKYALKLMESMYPSLYLSVASEEEEYLTDYIDIRFKVAQQETKSFLYIEKQKVRDLIKLETAIDKLIDASGGHSDAVSKVEMMKMLLKLLNIV